MIENIHYFTEKYYILESFSGLNPIDFTNFNLKKYKFYTPILWKSFGIEEYISILDFVEQVQPKDNFVINHGLLSTIVYNRIFNNIAYSDKILEKLYNLYSSTDISHIYLKHTLDPKVIESIYKESFLEECSNFKDYYLFYYTADQLYKELYMKLQITPRVFEAISISDWKEVPFI